MDPLYADLARDIQREKVLRARQASNEEKFFAGYQLFEYACTIARAGIRDQHPEADDAEVERLLARRIEIGRKLDAHHAMKRKELRDAPAA